MIQDYMALIGIMFIVALIFLFGSFISYILSESVIEVLFPTNSTDPMYNYTHGIGQTGITNDQLNSIRTIPQTIQIIGIVAQILYIIMGIVFVASVRYNPVGIVLIFIFYFVGIFGSMVYANIYQMMSQTLQQVVPSFAVNAYFDWINLKLPYIMAFVGGFMFILAYVKLPDFTGQQTGGGIHVGS
jgi:hypothetical protein